MTSLAISINANITDSTIIAILWFSNKLLIIIKKPSEKKENNNLSGN